MKRVIVLCLTLAFLLSALPMNFVSQASDDSTEAVIWEDFSRRKVGEKFDDDEIICAEKEGSAVCVNTLGALGAVNAVKFNYDSLRGYHNITGDQGFKIVYNEPKSLEDISHIIYYFRMPISRPDDKGNNWGKAGVAIMMYLGGYDWASFKDQAEIEILSKDGHQWKTLKTFGMYLDLPSGFEGYIKVGIDDYKSDKNLNKLSVHQTILQFSNMGGISGPGYLNAVYGVTKNTNSIKVKLNGEKEGRYYTTGVTDNDLKANRKLIDNAMRAEVLHTFSSYPMGYDLDEYGVMAYQHKRNINSVLAPNVGGLLGYPSVEISSKTLGGIRDSNPFYELKYPAYTYADDMEAILFYIKAAKPHPGQPDVSTFRFNIYTTKGDEHIWTLLGEGKAKYLEKGSKKWKVAESDDQGIMFMPANFEGFVMADLSEMKMNPIYGNNEGRSMVSSTLQFQAVGGLAGNCYVGGIYKITNKTDKLETLITFNECDVYSLSDGEIADDNDLIVQGPVIGEPTDGIPVATTTTHTSKVTEITSDSIVVEYDAVKGASNYRVDVYENVSEGIDSAVYHACAQSVKVSPNETKVTVTGLEPAKRYYVVVSALNSLGEPFEVFRYHRITTKSSRANTGNTVVNAFKDTSGIDANVITMEKDYTVLIIIIAMAAVAVVGGAVVTVMVVKNKRKGGAK